MRKAQKDKPMELREVVRARLRQLRAERGLSAQALVHAMGHYGVATTRSAWANYENNLREDISFTEAVAVALVLEVPLAELVAESTDDRPVQVGESLMSTAGPWPTS